jgi:predicted secreted protein
MASDKSMVEKALSGLLEKANSSHLTPLRLKDWRKVIEWRVDDRSFFWASDGSQFCVSSPFPADFVLKLSALTLNYVAEGKLPFFIGLWGTGDIAFEGSFSDAYRLGYVFLSDKRKRRVIFISHCWLNINTRFPEGSAFEGANVPLIKTLLDSGLGIIQMPCPEYECLGLEKWDYGEVIKDDLRACFRKQAEVVLKQIKNYLALGFEIVGILGMNPSPSCGVDVAKAKAPCWEPAGILPSNLSPAYLLKNCRTYLPGKELMIFVSLQ